MNTETIFVTLVFSYNTKKKILNKLSVKVACRALQYSSTVDLMNLRGGVVVKALRYKPTGRGFDSLWCNSNFSVT